MSFNNPKTNNNSSEHQSLDIFELMIQLWRGKLIICITIVITLIAATSYIFFAKEKWVSVALITQPDAGQISDYTHALNIIYGDSAPKILDTQGSLIERFSSAFSALSETLNNLDDPEKLTIEAAVKNQNLPLKVTYTGQTALIAQKKLAQYIQQVDETVGKELSVDLNTTIQARKAELEQYLTSQEKVVKEQKDLRMAQIVQALTVAQNAKIKSPNIQQADQVSQDTMFMLGSDALSTMIKNDSSRPLPFSDNYYRLRQSLFDVTNLVNNEVQSQAIKSDNLHSYRYVMKPSQPIRRESPKRALTIILAIIIGGVIGSAIVLFKNMIRASN